MNISDVAQHSGLPAKTIRYYEDIGLIKPLRDPNGYRAFRDTDVHKLVFLGRARALGFSIQDCRTLLALWEDKSRASADVRQVAADHLTQIEAKIADLAAMRDTLSHLIHCCAGDNRPDCPILTSLGGQTPRTRPPRNRPPTPLSLPPISAKLAGEVQEAPCPRKST